MNVLGCAVSFGLGPSGKLSSIISKSLETSNDIKWYASGDELDLDIFEENIFKDICWTKDMNEIKKFIEKNGLSESTEIVPADSDLYSLLRNADIYVSPAREAEGLDELLDAMASKLPVVATDVAGADELVANAVSGLLVNAGEEEPLTVALDDLMVNWGKRVGMAIEASHMKDRFPFDAFAALFDEE